MEKNVRTLAVIEAELQARVDEGNALVKAGTITADFLKGFDKLETEYATIAAVMTYNQLKTKENPKVAAIKQLTYTVKKHKENWDNEAKKLKDIELVQKEKQIDLAKFCKHADLDTLWVYEVMGYNQLLCLRTADELGYSLTEIKELAKSYYLAEKAKEYANGDKPVSNNKMCQSLQKVIDAILPPEDEAKGNVYKCNNHDIAYLITCYAKKGRKALSVAVAKDGYLRTLITDIMHRVIENKRYEVEYKRKKDDVVVVKPIPEKKKATVKKAAKFKVVLPAAA